jgi:hypothetical protein
MLSIISPENRDENEELLYALLMSLLRAFYTPQTHVSGPLDTSSFLLFNRSLSNSMNYTLPWLRTLDLKAQFYFWEENRVVQKSGDMQSAVFRDVICCVTWSLNLNSAKIV